MLCGTCPVLPLKQNLKSSHSRQFLRQVKDKPGTKFQNKMNVLIHISLCVCICVCVCARTRARGQWKRITSAPVSKGCCSHRALSLQPPGRRALRELSTKTNGLPSAKPTEPSAAAASPKVPPEETQGQKAQDAGPRQPRCTSKEGFQ